MNIHIILNTKTLDKKIIYVLCCWYGLLAYKLIDKFKLKKFIILIVLIMILNQKVLQTNCLKK